MKRLACSCQLVVIGGLAAVLLGVVRQPGEDDGRAPATWSPTASA